MPFPTLAEFCAAGCDINSISNEEFKSLVVQYLCAGGGGGGGGVVGGALEATQQDVLTAQEAALASLVAGFAALDTANAQQLEELQVINSNTDHVLHYSTQNGVLVSTTVTNAGSVAAGRLSVSIVNVGAANGLVDGQPLLPGESFNLEAVFDNTDRRLYDLPAISYDGTGTSLRIRTFGN